MGSQSRNTSRARTRWRQPGSIPAYSIVRRWARGCTGRKQPEQPNEDEVLVAKANRCTKQDEPEVEDEGLIEEEGQANRNETKTKSEMPTERKTSKAYVSQDLPAA